MPRKAAAERRTARAAAEPFPAAQGQSPVAQSDGKVQQCSGKALNRDATAKRGMAVRRQGIEQNGHAWAKQRSARQGHSSGVRFVAMALVCADTLGVGKAKQRMVVATLRPSTDAHGQCVAKHSDGVAWVRTAMA